MALIGTVPRRCVNLPPGSLGTLLGSVLTGKVQRGPAIDEFAERFGTWLDVPHVFGAAQGRSAFQAEGFPRTGIVQEQSVSGVKQIITVLEAEA